LNITAQQNKATGELVDLVADKIGEGRAIHPETAISASARLSGSLLFRSFNLRVDKAEPGTVVLSEDANQKGPMLVNTMAAFLSGSGVSMDALKVDAQAGRGEEPRLGLLPALSLLQAEAIKIGENHGLTLEQSAQAAALATAFIVKECIPQIGAGTAFNVAVYGFVEGSKTMPPSIGDAPKTPVKVKPWYQFW